MRHGSTVVGGGKIIFRLGLLCDKMPRKIGGGRGECVPAANSIGMMCANAVPVTLVPLFLFSKGSFSCESCSRPLGSCSPVGLEAAVEVWTHDRFHSGVELDWKGAT